MLCVAEIAVGPQDAERNRQIEAGTFLADVRRCQVDCCLVKGKEERTVVDGRLDALSRFADGEIRQADNGYGCGSVRLVPHRSKIDLHVDQIGVDAIDCGGLGAEEHGSLWPGP